MLTNIIIIVIKVPALWQIKGGQCIKILVLEFTPCINKSNKGKYRFPSWEWRKGDYFKNQCQEPINIKEANWLTL